MLVEFRVKNFRNFQEELVLNLNHVESYDFSYDAIKDQIIKTCLIYGKNGSGKSNLGLALQDLTHHLTDDKYKVKSYNNHFNFQTNNVSTFLYQFKFGTSSLIYKYTKELPKRLLKEELYINDTKVIFYDHLTHECFVTLEGAERLNKDLKGKQISFVKYLCRNTILSETINSYLLKKFINFVEKMKIVSSFSLSCNFEEESHEIEKKIIDSGKLKGLERFMKNVGVEYSLFEREIDGESFIYCDLDGKSVNFFRIASSGTYSLVLLYYQLMELPNLSLIFIDQFDTFLENKLAELVIKKISKSNTQAILTTHNTSLIDNNIL
ncbi:AAA family ATPase, partial [Neobacillus niacini]|uniref:AAA family ATPase n=1 Tax=Neobacillus niacini TaxID=86668 RepID=UPI002FFFC05F